MSNKSQADQNKFGNKQVIIGVVSLAVIAGVFYLWLQNGAKLTQDDVEIIEVQNPVKKQVEAQKITEDNKQVENIKDVIEMNLDIDISNWQTYRSEEYDIEFKYPEDWKIFNIRDFNQEYANYYDDRTVLFMGPDMEVVNKKCAFEIRDIGKNISVDEFMASVLSPHPVSDYKSMPELLKEESYKKFFIENKYGRFYDLTDEGAEILAYIFTFGRLGISGVSGDSLCNINMPKIIETMK